MEILTVIVFFIYLYGLGYSLTRFIDDNSFAAHVIRLGTGLAALPVVGIILGRLHLVLDWRIFLLVSLVLPIFDLVTGRFRNSSVPLFRRPSACTLIVLLIFAVNAAIYCGGPFAYPWLENDDSWNHAAGIRFLAVEQTLDVPSGVFQYINPYPPGYDLIFSVLHQVHPSIYWVLKFFNGLIIALSFLFFYVFAKEWTSDDKKALLATCFLACTPCYLSHFIWAHAVVVPLFFVVFALMQKSQKDSRYWIPAAIVVAGMFMTQHTQSIKFIILLMLWWSAVVIVRKKMWSGPVIVLVVAGLLSLAWWGPVIYDLKTKGIKYRMRSNVRELDAGQKTSFLLSQIFDPKGGTATRAYRWEDYVFAPEHNMINNPLGVGPTLCFLGLIGMLMYLAELFRKREDDGRRRIEHLTILFWLAFTFVGMNTATFDLPIGLFAFRFWMLFAVPVAFLAAEAFLQILAFITRPLIRYAAGTLFLVSIAITSGYPKFDINTGIWPWGVGWTSKEELKGYLWLKDHLPAQTKVFSFTRSEFLPGFDMHSDYWRTAHQEAFDGARDMPVDELHSRLKDAGFEYVIVGERDLKTLGQPQMTTLMDAMNASPLFQYRSGIQNSVWIFQVK